MLSQEANYYQSIQVSQNTLMTPKNPNRLDQKIRDLVSQNIQMNEFEALKYQNQRMNFDSTEENNGNTLPNDITFVDNMPSDGIDGQSYDNDDELNLACSQK